jgi:hypothetical protein
MCTTTLWGIFCTLDFLSFHSAQHLTDLKPLQNYIGKTKDLREKYCWLVNGGLVCSERKVLLSGG